MDGVTAEMEYYEKRIPKNYYKQPKRLGANFPLYALPVYLKSDPFLLYCFKRVNYQNKNVLGAIVGETGAGKSCTAVTLADMIDITPLGEEKYVKNFVIEDDGNGNATPETRVVFRATDFLRLAKSNLPRGSVIIWDEAGIENDNTRWYDKKSRIVKYVLQAFRHKNYVLFMTVPDLESIAKSTRRLLHVVIDVQERDDDKARCNVTWLQRSRKFDSTKAYAKRPAYVDPLTNRPTLVEDYYIRKIRPELEKPYNRIKERFTAHLYDFAEKEMVEMEKIETNILGTGKEKRERDELAPFNLMRCMDIAKRNRARFEFDGVFNKEKLIFLMGENGYVCKATHAKIIIENLEVGIDKK